MASFSFVASGNITKSRFIAQVGGGYPFTARPITSTTDLPVGVSSESSYNDPGVAGYYGATTFPAGVDTYSFRVYQAPETCLLELGGTVSAGQYIKTDNVGRGVVATATTDNVYARALEDGVSGDYIRVNLVDRVGPN